ncbi:unnamed protein product [Phytophthora lilii]|uniref:Unnamed protein product n=1 Tax=Phytophthora lilii TaxID=2077276 RepID=A0A9W6X087_9STRA|nr:unnamed protein product [Phytophthora lilii]
MRFKWGKWGVLRSSQEISKPVAQGRCPESGLQTPCNAEVNTFLRLPLKNGGQETEKNRRGCLMDNGIQIKQPFLRRTFVLVLLTSDLQTLHCTTRTDVTGATYQQHQIVNKSR